MLQKISSRPSQAFSLIEMLVVMAIIAILVTIGVSVIVGAKAQAHVAQCGSNIRQVALAMRMYAQDHDGRFPAVVVSDDTSNRLYSYAGALVAGDYLPRYGLALTCPLDPNIQNALSQGKTPRSFGLITPAFQGTSNYTPVSINDIEKPLDRVAMLMDWLHPGQLNLEMTTAEGLWGAGMGADQVSEPSRVNRSSAHRGGARNVAFVDGHVEFLTPAQIMTDGGAMWRRTWLN